MSRPARILRLTLVGLTLSIALVLIMLFALQRQMIYPGTGPDDGSWAAPPPGYQTVKLRTADGLALNALYRAPEDGAKTLIFFHGNGDSALNSSISFEPVLAKGQGALMVSYRGYAGNPGTPGEEGLYADGEAGLDFLRAQGIADSQIVVGGFSLGTGIASHVATKGDFAGLLLAAPFSALVDVAGEHFPFLPTGMIIRDRYLTRDRLTDSKAPLLIVHGEKDGIIPVAHGRRLAALRPDATFATFAAAGHNDVGHHSMETVRDWFQAL